MAGLVVENLTKEFKNVKAVNNVSFEVEDGKFVTVVGPSGCGKTTLLRSIAGLTNPEGGRILVDDEPIVDVEKGMAPIEPEKRGFGMVFQSYALWPHMNVMDNVAYPLKIKKVPKQERVEKVRDMLKLVHLEGMEKRMPYELSGGQQQRVALARALVMNPKLLLLDESLSNLDAALREEMRSEIKDIQYNLGITIINVTHDQVEAISMSDKVVILKDGNLVQYATPEEIYRNPQNTFVAKFFGFSNIVPATREQSEGTDTMTVTLCNGYKFEVPAKEYVHKNGFVSIRFQHLKFAEEGMKGKVKKCLFEGGQKQYFVEIAKELEVRVVTDAAEHHNIGDNVYLIVSEGVWLDE